jgi:predicted metal-dependent hydrolase
VASRPDGSGTVLDAGRAKAYRPLPARRRTAALTAAIRAYERGDFFQAHELLEPAWMGTDDLGERALHQGLIKLAAAYVHGVRGNPRGIEKNLVGARERLAGADGDRAAAAGIDLVSLLGAIDDRLAALRRHDAAAFDPPRIRRTDP